MAVRWLLIFFLILMLSAVFGFAADRIAAAGDDLVNGDFFTFWLAGRMVAVGENPYDQQTWVANHARFGASWIPNPTYIYPLPLAVLMSPLGSFDLGQAARIWIFLSLWMILAASTLLQWIAVGDLRLALLVPFLAGIFTFRATLVTLRNGQMGAFFLLVLVLVILAWSRERWVFGGLLLSFLALKPSFGMPLLFLVSFWLVITSQWRAIGGLLLSLLGLAVLGWIVDLGWPGKFLAAGQDKFSTNLNAFPNLIGWCYGVFDRNLPLAFSITAAIAVILIAVLLRFLWTRRQALKPAEVVSLLIPAALLLSLYLWAYDQILLIIPIIMTAGALVRLGKPYWFSASLPLLFSIGSLFLLFLAFQKGDDSWSVLCSVVSLAWFGFLLDMRSPAPAKVSN